MDLIDEITNDHRFIRNELEALVSPASNGAAKKKAFGKLSQLLEYNTDGEERSVYAYAKEIGALEHFALKGLEEHQGLERMVERIKNSHGSAIRAARSAVLANLLKQHLDDEETDFFPALRHELSPADAERLYQEYREHAPDLRLVEADHEATVEEPAGEEDDAELSPDLANVLAMPRRNGAPFPSLTT